MATARAVLHAEGGTDSTRPDARLTSGMPTPWPCEARPGHPCVKANGQPAGGYHTSRTGIVPELAEAKRTRVSLDRGSDYRTPCCITATAIGSLLECPAAAVRSGGPGAHAVPRVMRAGCTCCDGGGCHL